VNEQSRPPKQKPVRRAGPPVRPLGPRGVDLPWKGPAARTASWSPTSRPLEGKVFSPASRELSAPRHRGRFLTVVLPSVLGGTLGISTFVVFGVSSLIGGAGLLAPLLGGLVVGVVVGGGSGFLLRNRRPQAIRLAAPDKAMPAGTRTLLEKTVRATTQHRRRIARMRRATPGPEVRLMLNRADVLLQRVSALLASTAMQARRASDADVILLEGMATRYIPDLVDAVEDNLRYVGTFTGDAREQALANLRSVEEQLVVLDDGLSRVEDDVIAAATRTLDVHSEFLRTRFADQQRDPLADG
jgi:hypothetical protein